ncbi:hypothetical protein [Vibrio sp. D431a]|uniref:hypothetical protein n=1 Tax=Vibrio sp. D431a TaxID=2837388 RepID=UPI002555A64A|nr:hypothetical protein [Vibrio sp. D431a]MDK9790067.1 hypothetical protein [Vibrio sp. D431a]
MDKVKANVVTSNRKAALEKIKEILRVGDVEAQFQHRCRDYHSSEKFIVTWVANWQGYAAEYKLSLTENMYRVMSGYECIYGVANLFNEHQFSGYQSVERGLLEVGLKLCANKSQKNDFFEEFAVPYNNRLKQKQESNND